MSSHLQFHTLDVFTEQRYGGNPLAVVLAADGLNTRQMQTIAREFNLSETVFVLKPTAPGADFKVRIFTPQIEMPTELREAARQARFATRQFPEQQYSEY